MRINESTIRRIIREEARRVLHEGNYGEGEEFDVEKSELIKGFTMGQAAREIIGEEQADDLVQRLKGTTVNGGMVFLKKSGGGWNIFSDLQMNIPINAKPVPADAFRKIGIDVNIGYGSTGERARKAGSYQDSYGYRK
jgi:hypothetical protein